VSIVEIIFVLIGIPVIVGMAILVDRKKKNESSDFFTLDDDDF
jgi:LPXTG-motif cell wall-anchored protein